MDVIRLTKPKKILIKMYATYENVIAYNTKVRPRNCRHTQKDISVSAVLRDSENRTKWKKLVIYILP